MSYHAKPAPWSHTVDPLRILMRGEIALILRDLGYKAQRSENSFMFEDRGWRAR